MIESLENLTIQPTIFDGMRRAQELDHDLLKVADEVRERKETSLTLSDDGILYLDRRLCVPNDEEMRK